MTVAGTVPEMTEFPARVSALAGSAVKPTDSPKIAKIVNCLRIFCPRHRPQGYAWAIVQEQLANRNGTLQIKDLVLASSKAPSHEENVNTFVPIAFRFRTRNCGSCLVGGQYRENGISHGLVELRVEVPQSSRNRSPQLAQERRLFPPS